MIQDFYRGDTKVVRITLTNPDTTPIDVSGWAFTVTLKIDPETSDSGSTVVSKRFEAISGASGIVDIILDASLTNLLIGGETYQYDIQAVQPIGWNAGSIERKVVTMARGTVRVLSDVTKNWLPPTP